MQKLAKIAVANDYGNPFAIQRGKHDIIPFMRFIRRINRGFDADSKVSVCYASRRFATGVENPPFNLCERFPHFVSSRFRRLCGDCERLILSAIPRHDNIAKNSLGCFRYIIDDDDLVLRRLMDNHLWYYAPYVALQQAYDKETQKGRKVVWLDEYYLTIQR